jgi:flagellar FliL protein
MSEEMEGMEATESAQGGGGGLLDTVKKYLPLIAGVLVVQILIGYVLVKWVFAPSAPPPETHETKVEKKGEKAEAKVKPAKKKKKEGGGHGGEGGLEAADEILGIFDKLDPITVNTAGSGGVHYVQIQVHLGLAKIEEVKGEELAKLVDSRKGKILDTVIRLATAMTYDELNTQEGRDKLKEEIRKQVNLFLSDEHEIVKEVYFPTFTTQ